MSTIWLNGDYVDPGDAQVGVLDHGITVGDGVFETMRTEAGVPFAIRRHLARLRRSLDGLGLTLDYGDDELATALRRIAELTVGDDVTTPARVRLTVTGGAGPLGSGRNGSPVTAFIAGATAEPWPTTTSAITVEWRRNEHSAVAGLKTTSYAENVVALDRAHRAGADEAVFANTAGNLCEGTGTNVFVVLDGRIVTPPLSSGCLAGITRELVCEIVDVDERDLPLSILEEADEIFVTSSTRDVQGLHRIDDRTLQAPGEMTAMAMAAFADLVARDLDP